jgi:hypothetical protein
VRQELVQIAPAVVNAYSAQRARSIRRWFLMSILTWWLELKPSLEALEVDAIFRQLTIPAIEAALGSTACKTLV